VHARNIKQLLQRINLVCSGRVIDKLTYKIGESLEIVLNDETFEKLSMLSEPMVIVYCDTHDDGEGLNLKIKFLFEAEPRLISASNFERLLGHLSRQIPAGFSSFEKLTFEQEGVHITVDDAVLEDIEDLETIFYAHYHRDTSAMPPTRLVFTTEDGETPHRIKALMFTEFMEALSEYAESLGRDIFHVTYLDNGVYYPLTEEKFYDLKLSTTFAIELAPIRAPNATAQVQFNATSSPLALPADTFNQLMEAISLELEHNGEELDSVTYSVEGPAPGKRIEFNDLCEELFDGFEDITQYVFKVYGKSKQKAVRLVLLPNEEKPRSLNADTYDELIAAVSEITPFECITYDVPAPKGGFLTFDLSEDAWCDLDDAPDTVFTVHTKDALQLPVLLPNQTKAQPLPAASYLELEKSIRSALPVGMTIDRLSYFVEGPRGNKIEVPLTSASFEDIEDAQTVVSVKTKLVPVLLLNFSPIQISWPETYDALISSVESNRPPHRNIEKLLTRQADGSTREITANNYKALDAVSCPSIDVVFKS
jgi:hypothetical protein